MPVDIDSSATFGDLLLKLAVRVGYAVYSDSAAPALPTDTERLTRLKLMVNGGYDRFLRAYKRWSFQEVVYSLRLDPTGQGPRNIAGDSGRYRAPAFVSGPPITPWSYTDTRTYLRSVATVHPSIIMGYRQTLVQLSGAPRVAASRALETGDSPLGQTRGWEFLFWPLPQYDFSMQATFRVKRHEMVELGEHHVAGSDHDAAIEACAFLVWQESDSAEDPSLLAQAQEQAAARVAESIELDIQNAPDSVGENGGRGESATTPQGYRLPLVASINGTPIAYE